ncbi:MAG TPA: penicillin-binding transpeptidase domain-containing protein, partial [Fimbriimonadaceae bacterium]|nr:penicillin-binding transpeptidase domain-containing protein [Fimbriimonadaceae bacterium]
YSPGSTFKIVVATAAMEKGIFSLSRPGVCRGFYAVGNRRSKCLGVHGAITFHSAFARSCNTYFSDLAVRVGPEDLAKTALRMGLGRKTGIDLPAESPGLVPTQEWLDSRNPPLKWYPGDTVNFGIGQGAMAATPLQMAYVAGLVANEGVGYRPHLVRAKAPGKGGNSPTPVKPELLSRIEAPPGFWRELKSAMVEVIASGTARGAATIPGLVWGGKTGSAEHRKREQTHSWFVGAAPMDNPKIAICVLVEAAGHGSTVAAPIARDIVSSYLKPAQDQPALPPGIAARNESGEPRRSG